MSWSEVIIDFSDDETVNFGKRFETFAENSLYRIRTLATIASSDLVLKAPCFFGRAQRKVCAIVVESFVHVFDTNSFQCLATVDFEKLIQNTFVVAELGLVIVDIDGVLHFFSYEKQQLLYSQITGNGTKSAVLDVYYFNGTFSIVSYSEADQCLRFICFTLHDKENWWKNKFDVTSSKTSIENLSFGKIERSMFLSEHTFLLLNLLYTFTISINGNIIAGILYCSHGLGDKYFLYNTTDHVMESGSPTVISVWKFESGILHLMNSVYSSFKSESFRFGSVVGNGEFLLCVDYHGNVYLYDLATLILMKKWNFGANVESFFVLSSENDETEKNRLLDIKFAAVCRIKEKYAFEIRTLNNFALLYSFVGASSMNIMFGLNDFDGICVLESAKMNPKSQFVDEIRIRLVEETIPYEKFNRLISRGQFREAEQFAVLYGLDFQMIYKAESKQLLTILNSLEPHHNDGSYTDLFIECINKISDTNFAADLCLNFSGSNPIIHERVLRHVLERLGDCSWNNDTATNSAAKKIITILYRYSTFRLLNSDLNSFRIASVRFRHSKIFDIFVHFIETGDYKNATIILRRHENEILMENIDEDFLNGIFTTISQQVLTSFKMLVHFLRDHFLPLVLLKEPLLVEVVAKFLFEFARSLEFKYPDDFPQNSLEFAEILKRISEKLVDSNTMLTVSNVDLSTYSLSIFTNIGKIKADAAPTNRLIRLISDLNRLNQFLSVYKFSLSLDEFVQQTDESLCYRMLEKTVASELLEKTITSSLQPFCQEKRLNMNLILFNYVKDCLQNCLLSPLDSERRSIIVYRFITSVEYKCQCILKLMEFAQLPFNPELDSLIKEAESFHHSLVSQIIKQKEFANVKRILTKYDMSLDYLKNPKVTIFRILTQYDIPDVIDDALVITAKFKCYPPIECYFIRLNHLLNNFQYERARELLKSLPLAMKKVCIDRSVDRISIAFGHVDRRNENKTSNLEHLVACLDTLSSLDDATNMCENFRTLKKNVNSSIVLWSKFGLSIDHFDHDYGLKSAIKPSIDSFLASIFNAEKTEADLRLLIELVRSLNLSVENFLLDLLQSLSTGIDIENLHKFLFIIEFIIDETLNSVQIDSLVDLFLKFLNQIDQNDDEIFNTKAFLRMKSVGYKLLGDCSEDRLVELSKALTNLNTRYVTQMLILSGAYYNNKNSTEILKSAKTNPPILIDILCHSSFGNNDIKLIMACLSIFPSYLSSNFASSFANSNSLLLMMKAWTNLIEKHFENYLLESPSDSVLTFSFLLTLSETTVETNFKRLMASNLTETVRVQEILYRIAGQLCQYRGDQFRLQAIEFYQRSLLIATLSKKLTNFDTSFSIFTDMFDNIVAKNQNFDQCRRIYAIFCPTSRDFEEILMKIVENRLTNANFLDEKQVRNLLAEIRRLTDELITSKGYRRKLVENFRRILWHVNPYSYEILKFCLEFASTRLDADVDSNEENLAKFHEKLGKFLKFLYQYKRRSSINNVEFGLGLGFEYAKQFHDQLSISSNIPEFYSDRLPFRCFYEKDKRFQTDFWSTVMKNELEFSNYELWAMVLKKFFSNGYVTSTDLLKLVIQNALNDSNVDENLLEKVESYLMKTDDYKNSLTIIAWLAEKLSSSDLKIKAYEICISLLNQWKNHLVQSEQGHLLSNIEEAEKNFTTICQKSRTEDLLICNDLLNASTKQLCDQPSRLIIHLLTSDIDCHAKDLSQVIRRIADINNVDLNKLFLARLKWWFYEHFGKRGVESGAVVHSTRLCDVLDLSFNTLNKIALLFNGKSDADTAYYLINMIQNDDSEITNIAKIQAIRVLFQLVAPQTLDELMLAPKPLENLHILHSIKLRTLLSDLIYVVWMEKLRIPRITGLTSFQEIDKQTLALSLCKNLTDNKNLYSLTVSLVVGYSIVDENVVNNLVQVAGNLKSNSTDVTSVLLNFIHKYPQFWSLKGVKKVWKDIAQTLQESSEADSINSLGIKRPEL